MAAWLRGVLLLFLLPIALGDEEVPCDGYEVVEGYGMADAEAPTELGVRVLEEVMDVENDEACWRQCCALESCDLAITSQGSCRLLTCRVKSFNMCELTAQEGARSLRRVELGVRPTQEDFCLSKGETGPCRAFFPRWWFDVESQSCINFTYGGCPVNLNNHPGEQECMEKCKGVTGRIQRDEPTPKPKEAGAELCSGPAVTGRCRAAFKRWHFDSESQSCHSFTYGGCGGNKNNHQSEQDCIDNCVGTKPEPAVKTTPSPVTTPEPEVIKPEPALVHAPKLGNFKEYCAAPAYTGNCRAAFRRFYYDASIGLCKTFIYGGCNANKNNYLTESDCQKTCAGRSEDDDHELDHNVLHRPLTAVVLPILLVILAATLLAVMIYSFVKVSKRNQQNSDFRAMWNPIDDKECLMNSAYTL